MYRATGGSHWAPQPPTPPSLVLPGTYFLSPVYFSFPTPSFHPCCPPTDTPLPSPWKEVWGGDISQHFCFWKSLGSDRSGEKPPGQGMILHRGPCPPGQVDFLGKEQCLHKVPSSWGREKKEKGTARGNMVLSLSR
jgi:hypothetical protein